MAEYHVGCGAFGIYAGTVNKAGTLWIKKSDVTQEAINAVALYMIENNKSIKVTTTDGKTYSLMVQPLVEVK